jgi:hypothetical protein
MPQRRPPCQFAIPQSYLHRPVANSAILGPTTRALRATLDYYTRVTVQACCDPAPGEKATGLVGQPGQSVPDRCRAGGAGSLPSRIASIARKASPGFAGVRHQHGQATGQTFERLVPRPAVDDNMLFVQMALAEVRRQRMTDRPPTSGRL